MSATLKINVGVHMSKAIVREKFKDFFKGKLSLEEETEIRDAYKSIYALLIDKDIFSISYLIRYSQGYTIEEISEIYGADSEDIKISLKFTFAIFGEVLQLDDDMIVRRIDKPLRVAAANVLKRIYEEFVEIE
jgi:hypothetical protein